MPNLLDSFLGTLEDNSHLSDWAVAVIALIALLFAWKTASATTRTTRLQARPFLDIRFREGASEREILEAISDRKGDPSFIIRNSGNSPCIVHLLAREWRIYGLDPHEGSAVSSPKPRKPTDCHIAIGANQESDEINSHLQNSLTDGLLAIGPDYRSRNHFLHFIVTAEFTSADSRDRYEARFTYILNGKKMGKAFPKEEWYRFSYQQPISKSRLFRRRLSRQH